MPNIQSALPGAAYTGLARVRDTGPRGMITLKGDLSAAKLKGAVKEITGCDVPRTGTVSLKDAYGIAWMAPDELLVLVPYADAPAAVSQLDAALAGAHALVVNVSDARVVIEVAGEGAREVLAKLTPADLHPDSFKPGQFRRTRLAQVASAFWMREDGGFEVVAFRSVAAYVFDILSTAARPGASVDYF